MGAIESGFNYTAKAGGDSSASGIFQFIDKTWKAMINKYGSKYGIAKDTLQTEPRANALMGAEYLKENMAVLKGTVTNRELNYTDAYMAHFLGPGGAKKFLSNMEKDPNQVAATIFPEEANANKPIFYNKDGTIPRTLSDIYNMFTTRINDRAKSSGIEGVGGGSGKSTPTTAPTTSPTSNTGAVGAAGMVSPTAPTNQSSPTTTSTPGAPTSQSNAPTVTPTSTPTDPGKTSPNVTSTPVVQQQAPQTVTSTGNNDHVKVLQDGNGILNGMATTLTSSLEVQMRMANSMDALSKILSNGNTAIDPNAVNKAIENNAKSTYKTGPESNSYNMPEGAVNLSKKKY
jgi:hypothetical protein